jgi:uncharacterized protein YhaN
VQLEEKLAAEESALGVVVRELEELEQGQILLSAAATGPASRADSLEALQAEEGAALERDLQDEEALEAKIRSLHRAQASLEGAATPNVAALEVEAGLLDEEVEEGRREVHALAMAYRWLDEAVESFQESHRERLATRISEHFRDLTGAARRIEVDERFAVTVAEPDGQPLLVDQLSQGARDQLLLALRLGVADLLAESVSLPFVFDDPFLNFDGERLAQAKRSLQRLGRRRPWILLTHRPELVEWAEPIFCEELADIEAMASPEIERP